MAHCQQTDLMQKSNGVYLELMDKYEKDMSAWFLKLSFLTRNTKLRMSKDIIFMDMLDSVWHFCFWGFVG